MEETYVVSDSSFIICFLDDIEKHEYLLHFWGCGVFKFVIGDVIHEEIKKSHNYSLIQDSLNSKISVFDYYNFGEIVRPFFSIDEIKKGEHEVYVIFYVLNFRKEETIAILDEIQCKNYLKSKMPHVSIKIIGTIGFIERCICKCKLLSKTEGESILVLIKGSKFWIPDKIIDQSINKIRVC